MELFLYLTVYSYLVKVWAQTRLKYLSDIC